MKKIVIIVSSLFLAFVVYYFFVRQDRIEPVNYSTLVTKGKRVELDFGVLNCKERRIVDPGNPFPFEMVEISADQINKETLKCEASDILVLKGNVEVPQTDGEGYLPGSIFVDILKTGKFTKRVRQVATDIQPISPGKSGKILCEFKPLKEKGMHRIVAYWGFEKCKKDLFSIPLQVN